MGVILAFLWAIFCVVEEHFNVELHSVFGHKVLAFRLGSLLQYSSVTTLAVNVVPV